MNTILKTIGFLFVIAMFSCTKQVPQLTKKPIEFIDGQYKDSAYYGNASYKFKQTNYYTISTGVVSLGLGVGVGAGVLAIQNRKDRFFWPILLGGLTTAFSFNEFINGSLSPHKRRKAKPVLDPLKLDKWKKDYNIISNTFDKILNIKLSNSSNGDFAHSYTTDYSIGQYKRITKFKKEESTSLRKDLVLLNKSNVIIDFQYLSTFPTPMYVYDNWDQEFDRNMSEAAKNLVSKNSTLFNTYPRKYGVFGVPPSSLSEAGKAYVFGSIKDNKLVGWTYVYSPSYRNINNFVSVFNNNDIETIKKDLYNELKYNTKNMSIFNEMAAIGYDLSDIAVTEFVGNSDPVNEKFTGGFEAAGNIMFTKPGSFKRDVPYHFITKDFFIGDGTWVINNSTHPNEPIRVVIPDPRYKDAKEFSTLFGRKLVSTIMNPHLLVVSNDYTLEEICSSFTDRETDYTGQVTETTRNTTTNKEFINYTYYRRKSIRDNWEELESQTIEETDPCQSNSQWYNNAKRKRFRSAGEASSDANEEMRRRYPEIKGDPYIIEYLKLQRKEDSVYSQKYKLYFNSCITNISPKKRAAIISRLKADDRFVTDTKIPFKGLWLNKKDNKIYMFGNNVAGIVDVSDRALALDVSPADIFFVGNIFNRDGIIKLDNINFKSISGMSMNTITESELLTLPTWVRLN
jgi:hypothetical protein